MKRLSNSIEFLTQKFEDNYFFYLQHVACLVSSVNSKVKTRYTLRDGKLPLLSMKQSPSDTILLTTGVKLLKIF